MRALTFARTTSTLRILTFASTETRMNTTDLATQHCRPRKGKENAIDSAQVSNLLQQLPGGQLQADGSAVVKDF